MLSLPGVEEPVIVKAKPRSQSRKSELIDGVRFSQISALYKFDQQLRLLVTGAIEKLEVAVRSKVAYHMAAHHPAAHTLALTFDPLLWRRQHAEKDKRDARRISISGALSASV